MKFFVPCQKFNTKLSVTCITLVFCSGFFCLCVSFNSVWKPCTDLMAVRLGCLFVKGLEVMVSYLYTETELHLRCGVKEDPCMDK